MLIRGKCNTIVRFFFPVGEDFCSLWGETSIDSKVRKTTSLERCIHRQQGTERSLEAAEGFKNPWVLNITGFQVSKLST